MLNPRLYKALQASFGRVLIDKEDVQADIERLPGSVAAWTLPESGEHGEQYRVNCPFCDDMKQHLYISYLSYSSPVVNNASGEPMQLMRSPLVAHCFRRNCVANQALKEQLNRMVGFGLYSITDDTPPVVANSAGAGYALDQDTAGNAPSRSVTLEGFRSWIPDYMPVSIDTDPEVLAYLRERRIGEEDVRRWNIGWGPIKSPRTGNYIGSGEPWVLLPLIQHGQLVGMQARALPQYQRDSFKYWLHPNCRKSTIVGNIDSAQKLGLAVICEGVFDAISVGAPGVCTFGYVPSAYQKMLLGSLDYGVIWLPDMDDKPDGPETIKIATEQCRHWNASGQFPRGAHVVKLPAKDAGSLTRQQVWDAIFAQVPEDMRSFLMARILPYL